MAQLAEFGVVFLLFAIGLELSWERLWTMRRFVFGLGGSQVVVCTGAIAGVAMLLGQDPVAAILLGSALALSSTAIVMPLLAELNRQFSRPGRATFSVLLMQDLAVAPLLVTIAVLGGCGEGRHRLRGADRAGPQDRGRAVTAFHDNETADRPLMAESRLATHHERQQADADRHEEQSQLRPMMRSVARADSEELFMAASLLIVVLGLSA
jgi:CPA2 family monovalent cation:H+ antiporter-2